MPGGERERKTINLDGFYDIETQDWTTFVMGGMTDWRGDYVKVDWRNETVFLDKIVTTPSPSSKRPAHVWAHNGGRFDHKWAIDLLMEEGKEEIELGNRPQKIQIIAAGANIISARRGDVVLYDLKALAKLSLKDFTAGLTVSKERLGLACIELPTCEPSCEGYCQIRRDMAPSIYSRVADYLEADVKSGFGAGKRLIEYAADIDLDLCPTVGASAWNCAQRWLDLPDACLDADAHKFARRSYFGGRVFVGKPFSPGVSRYASADEIDVSSMYPSRLAFCPIPVGEPQRLWGSDAQRAYARGKPGLYKAEVFVPNMHIPPLPLRLKNRIAYPVGRFVGHWAAPELRYAESLGCEVTIQQGLVYPREEIVFRDWVDKLFDLRRASPGGKDSPLGTFLKFILNSLTGKFGTRPDKERVVIFPDEVKACPCEGLCDVGRRCPCRGKCKGGCSGWCGAMRPLGNLEQTQIYAAPSWQIAPCAHVEWAAYLTAEARVEWHRQATSAHGGTDVVYGDTDSLFVEMGRIRNRGKELGLWESKGPWSEMRVLAPKIYSYFRGGKPVTKGKGLALPRGKDGKTDHVAALKLLVPGNKIKAASAIIGFRTGAAQDHFFQASVVDRTVGQGYGDRILEPGAFTTRPPTVAEIRKAILDD